MPLKRGSTGVVRLYKKEANDTQTEITELKDNQNRTIHKRVQITFNSNPGTGTTTQIRTWGVEQTTQPPNPTRSGYTCIGWATTSGATTPNVTFPRATPENNFTYHPVWQQDEDQLRWKYSEPVVTMCSCEGYSMTGMTCSVEGQTITRCGTDEGFSDGCVELICGKV